MDAVTRRARKGEIWSELERTRETLDGARQLELMLRARVKDLEAELGRLSDQTSYAIDRQRRLTADNEQLALLLNLALDLMVLDPERVLATAVLKIPYILRARTISLYLYDSDKRTLTLEDTNHHRAIDPLIDLNKTTSSLMALAVRTRQTLIVSDVGHYQQRQSSAEVSLPHREQYGTPSCMVTPLLRGEQILGVINLADRFDGRPFDRSDREAVGHVANLLGLAIDNARRLESLSTRIPFDPLTNLETRRSFMDRFETWSARARAEQSELSLVLCRLMNLSWLNGNYGLPAGDAALEQAARRIQTVAPEEASARVAGDVFAVLLPGRDLNAAVQLARALKAELSREPVTAGSHALKLEVSLGVAPIGRDRAPLEQLRAAESALAEADRSAEAIGIRT